MIIIMLTTYALAPEIVGFFDAVFLRRHQVVSACAATKREPGVGDWSASEHACNQEGGPGRRGATFRDRGYWLRVNMLCAAVWERGTRRLKVWSIWIRRGRAGVCQRAVRRGDVVKDVVMMM